MNTAHHNPLTLPTADAIPADSKPLLEAVQKKFGFVPNLITALSTSPPVLEAYLTLAELVSKTSFTPEEQQAGALIVSQKNSCSYCLAAHGTIGKSAGLDAATIVALQTGAYLKNPRLTALRTLLLSILETKGFPEPAAIEVFKSAGYTDTQLGEAVLIVTWKTLSNYTNHLYNTPIDAQFAANAAPTACSSSVACDCV
jgi:AhpD family alkylhydroperoxidase